MQPIQIRPIKQTITIRIAAEKVSLPETIQKKVDEYWAMLVSKNSRLRNGEVFTVTGAEDTAASLEITLSETNYAHYLYSQQVGGLGEYTVRIIHPCTMVITADNKLIFGRMGEHTSIAGVIQCCGGGLDNDDIEDGYMNTEHNAAKELGEELGIDPYDSALVSEFYPSYLKTGGPTGKMTVAYTLHSKQSGEAYLRAYDLFTRKLLDKGEEPEFDRLYCIAADEGSVEAFIAEHTSELNEYMAVLLRAVV
jgi:hypothetical protein